MGALLVIEPIYRGCLKLVIGLGGEMHGLQASQVERYVVL